MDFRVLGQVAVVADGEMLRLGGPKQRTVLALLLLDAGRTVPADVLIDGVWGDEPTSAAKSTLQSYVFNLRRVLGERLVTVGGGYRMAIERDDVDVYRFEDAVARADALVTTSPVDAAELLREALASWNGHPYDGVSPSVRLETEARRLDELRLKALGDRVDAELALGHHTELVAELEVLTTEYPLAERFRAQQMLALYRAGRQPEALRACRKARRYLADELGLELSPDLHDLEQRILAQDPELELATEPQVRAMAVLMTELDGSALLWEQHAEAMVDILRRHDELIDAAVAAAGGRVVSRTGDGLTAAFDFATEAIAAADRVQHAVDAEPWPRDIQLRVRMAVDSGDVEERGGDVFGPPLNRCARLLAAAHGGQVLLSDDAHRALISTGRAGWQAKALGEHRIRGLNRTQMVFQLIIDGHDNGFPPLRLDRPPSVLPSLGRTVRGFELRERVGGGAFGVVYRAYQPSVGREAAVKVIRPEYVNDPEFVRRFEAEAQTVAQLEHPHIIPLYDFWREPSGAFLVTRWMRGGTLRAALERDGPWDLGRAMTLLRQVGGAVAHAHRHGVIHGDLKPANVLLDDDGNAYVADFGIAARSSLPSGAPTTSSPSFAAPEQLNGGPVTERTDVYALGLVARELLGGAGRMRPVAIEATITGAVSPDPDDRFPTVGAFVTAVAEAAGEPDVEAEIEPLVARNPYKGLRAFQESDRDDFFGRADVVSQLAEAVGTHRLVAVTGPSGIGKSSVVRAGLTPHVRADPSGADPWLVTDMIPGVFPFDELAAALLRVSIRRPDNLVDDLAASAAGLAAAARDLLPAGCRALLVIDQFEELFTLTTEGDVRRRFIDSLTTLAADPRNPLSVLVTVRADFLDRPLAHPELGELLTAGTVLVAAPGHDELVEAIARPAENVGLRLEPGLAERIAAEVSEQPGGLPLLQYALTELFEQRRGNMLTAADYERVGGVLGALSRRADELYGELGAAGREAARQVFLRLVAVDESGQDTRRRVPRRELRALPIEPAALDTVLARCGEQRLLTFDRHPVTRAPTVEVAHEALFAKWALLRGWIGERREDLLLHRRLAEAGDEWEQSERQPDYLLAGGRLAQFESLAASTDIALSTPEAEFLGASRTAADRQSRRRHRVRRALVGVLFIALVAMTAMALNARQNQQRASESARRADAEADLARSRELAAAAVAVLPDDPSLSKLLAVMSAEHGELTTESIAALHQAWAADPVVNRLPEPKRPVNGTFVALDPSGERAVVAGWGDLIAGWNYLEVVDPLTGEVQWTFEPASNSANPTRPFFSPDGADVVVGSIWVQKPWEPPEPDPESLGAFFLDADTGEIVDHIDLGRCGGIVEAMSASHLLVKTLHGAAAATCDWLSSPTAVELVDRRGGERTLLTADGSDWWAGGALSADGRFVAFDDFATGTASVVEVQTGQTVLSLESQPRFVRAISNDGSLLAYGEPIEIWDVAAGELVATYGGHQGESFYATFDPSGTAIYSAGEDGSLHHWDARTGEPIWLLPQIGQLSISAGGGLVAVTRSNATTSVVDTTVRGEIGAVETCPGSVLRDSLNVSGSLLAFGIQCDGDPDATTYVAEVDTGVVRYTLGGQGGDGMAISPDGTQFVRQEADGATFGTLTIRALETGEMIVELDGLCEFDSRSIQFLDDREGCGPYPQVPFALWSARLRWSPDGTMLASESRAGAIVWDTSTGELLHAEEAPPTSFWLREDEGNWAFDVWFTPDSSQLLVSGNGEVRSLDTDSWELERQTSNNSIGGYAFGFLDTAGDALVGVGRANGDPGGTLIWIDPESLEWQREVAQIHEAGISSRALSPDQTLVATGAADGLVRVWDAASGVLVHEIPFVGSRVAGVAFVGDQHLAVAVDGGNVVFVTIDGGELLDLVRGSLARGFTEAECDRFDLGDACPTLVELRGPAPGSEDPSVLNGTYELDWTIDHLVTALIEANPEENLSREFAEIAWTGTFGVAFAGEHTLRLADGRYDHTVIDDTGVEWRCVGSYSISGGRVDFVNERGPCDERRTFDSTFEVTDVALSFTDYDGHPLEGIIYAFQPWQRVR